jgi:MFS transporter, UMF1 family
MAFFERSALNPGVRGREVAAWAMYDFANSGYTTVVLTAVFNAYFVGVIAQGADWATLIWTVTLAASNLLVMLTMPAIGAHADAHAAKKRALAAGTVLCVAATIALAYTGPGTLALAVAAVVISNYAFSVGESMVASFLPELARPQAMGKVSGWGWSFGYFGGMAALGLSLAWVIHARSLGQGAEQFVPVTMWITAILYAVASLPTFLFLRERATPAAVSRSGSRAAPASSDAIAGALSRLRRTLSEASHFSDFFALLVCGVLYQAGIGVVIALAAIYAEQVMGFDAIQTMTLVFLVNIASAAGAFAFGYWQDRVGHRRALAVTLAGWLAMVALVGFGTSVPIFWCGATLAGLCMGSSQSCGRAMVGVLAPANRLGEFFGLWTLAGRLASIVGPLTYGVVTWATSGNHRLGILTTGVFFLGGMAVLSRIDMQRGERQALKAL